MGLISTGKQAFMTALQRLNNLVPTSATHAEKMHVAGLVADSLTETLVADTRKKEQKSKMPLACHRYTFDIVEVWRSPN